MSSDTYPPNDGQSDETRKAAADARRDKDAAPDEADAEASAKDEAPVELGAADALRAEITALNEKVLRLAAEVENTRRRGEREKADASRYAIGAFARDMLAIADNLERALASAPDDAANGEVVSGFVTGVRMTERTLAAALERHGVKRIDPKGEKFDPNLHQAVAQAPAQGVPAGHVAETAQAGFIIGDPVLRAARVLVSTGEPAPARPAGSHVDTSA
jgi:molecular chaperone GrpE